MMMTPPTAPPTAGPMIASGPPTFVFIVVGVACTVIVDCLIEVGVVSTAVGVVIRTGMVGDVDDNTLVVRGNDDEGAMTSGKCKLYLLEHCNNYCSWLAV